MSTENLNIVKKIKHSDFKNLVLLHGWGFDHSIFNHLEDELNTRYNLYKIDLPGFGKSDSMSWENFKNILKQSLPSEVILLGWSLGGLFATKLTLELNAQNITVSHLINVASSPRFIAQNNWHGVLPLVFDKFYAELEYDPEKVLQDFMRLQLRKSNMLSNILIPEKYEIASLKSGLEILKDWDLRIELSSLKIPVAFMFGRLDAIVPAKVCSDLQKIYPHFYYKMFPKAAHMPFLSDAQEFVRTLFDFTTHTN